MTQMTSLKVLHAVEVAIPNKSPTVANEQPWANR